MQKLRLELKYLSRKIGWLFAALLIVAVSGCSAGKPSLSETLNHGINFGDWKQTEALCNQILEKNPDDADALLARARLKIYFGKSNEAIADCERVLVKSPQYARALLRRGTLLCDAGKKQEGETDLKSYLSLTQLAHDAGTLSGRATAFSALKDPESSKKQSQEIIGNTASTTEHANILHRGIAQAELNKFKDAIETLTKLKQIYPTSPYLGLWIAYCHSENGQSELALREFAAAAERAPSSTNIEGSWAYALEKEQKYDEAIRHFEKALLLENDNLFALRHRGWCHLRLQNNNKALDDFNKALALEEPDDTGTLLYRAQIYHNFEQHKEAIAECRRVIALDARIATAWCQLGDSLAHLKQWKEAYASCTHAIALAPNDTTAFCIRAWVRREMGNREMAFADYGRAIAIDPKLEFAYYSRGVMYRDDKLYTKSIADLSAAVRLSPTSAVNYCARGCAEVRNGDYKEAIADCTKSIELNSNSLHPYLSRGEAYSALGQNTLALSDLTHVLDHHPVNTEALSERAKVYEKLHKTKLAADDLARLKSLK